MLSERYKKDINPEHLWIARRSDSYFEEISNFSILAESISNTFKWFGKDEKRNKREIIFLYQLITGSNNLKLNLLHPNVTQEDFLSLFSNQTLSSKIIWNYDLGVLIYFIGKLANEFLILPDNIEIKGTNKTSKKLWIYLNEKIIACFVDKNGNSLNRTQLNSLRNKFKTENNQSVLLIDDIISAVLIFS